MTNPYTEAVRILTSLQDDLERREQECRELLTTVPRDESDINVRQHVRLMAKAGTYEHAKQMVSYELQTALLLEGQWEGTNARTPSEDEQDH